MTTARELLASSKHTSGRIPVVFIQVRTEKSLLDWTRPFFFFIPRESCFSGSAEKYQETSYSLLGKAGSSHYGLGLWTYKMEKKKKSFPRFERWVKGRGCFESCLTWCKVRMHKCDRNTSSQGHGFNSTSCSINRNWQMEGSASFQCIY